MQVDVDSTNKFRYCIFKSNTREVVPAVFCWKRATLAKHVILNITYTYFTSKVEFSIFDNVYRNLNNVTNLVTKLDVMYSFFEQLRL